MRTLPALAAIALSASMLTGCGGSGSDAYCDQLKEDKKYFDSFNSGNPDPKQVDEAFNRLQALADEAPDEIADDWKVLDEAIGTVEAALKDAGVTFEDLGEMQSGKVPEGVDVAKLQALVGKLDALSSEKFEKASEAIEKHAKDECNVTLS